MLRDSLYITDFVNPVLASLVDSKVIMNLVVDFQAYDLVFLGFL